MIKRKIQKEISKWLNSEERSALLISGVRQAGKTFIIEDTLVRENRDYVKVNLIEQEEVLRTAGKYNRKRREDASGNTLYSVRQTVDQRGDSHIHRGSTGIQGNGHDDQIIQST